MRSGEAEFKSAGAFAPPDKSLAGTCGARMLRRLILVSGIAAAVLYLVVGALERLQMYGDGSIFSYSIAVQDTWAFHWHNIPERLTIFLLSMWPAELWTGLTGNPSAGIFLYGLLFFAIQPLGLAATALLDRTRERTIFTFACASTALLCPLVFGFPTEMWMAHALFWPTLALAQHEESGFRSKLFLWVLMIALVLTHEGGLILASAIVVGLLPRGISDPRLIRAGLPLLAGLGLFLAIKLIWPPDDYYADVLVRAGEHFFDESVFFSPLMRLLLVTLAGYGCLVALLRLGHVKLAPAIATSCVALGLIVFWLVWDHALHAENRYYSRTLLFLGTFVVGALTNLLVLRGEPAAHPAVRMIGSAIARLGTCSDIIAGACALVLLVHVVETVKFVRAWNGYEAAVRALAIGSARDPWLGDPQFVSSARISASLNRMSWFSTTPYLSVILSGFEPRRLVIDPTGNYFWLSCRTATENTLARRSVPQRARELVRIYSCLHRY